MAAMMTPNRGPEPGMRVAVTVDANDLDHLDAHWDSVFGEMPAGVLGYAAEAAAGAFGVDVDLSGIAARPAEPEPARDWQARIAVLNDEYRAGYITYEEM